MRVSCCISSTGSTGTKYPTPPRLGSTHCGHRSPCGSTTAVRGSWTVAQISSKSPPRPNWKQAGNVQRCAGDGSLAGRAAAAGANRDCARLMRGGAWPSGPQSSSTDTRGTPGCSTKLFIPATTAAPSVPASAAIAA